MRHDILGVYEVYDTLGETTRDWCGVYDTLGEARGIGVGFHFQSCAYVLKIGACSHDTYLSRLPV